jgi:chemotaxis protein CheZ
MTGMPRRFRIEKLNVEQAEMRSSDRHAEILAAIAELRAELRGKIHGAGKGEDTETPAATDSGTQESRQRQLTEFSALKQELDSIQEAIIETKEELASLQVGNRAREIARMTDELDAVVRGTEEATETVLQAAETIDRDAADLAAALKKTGNMDLVADIRDQVVTIFEACNFQDLTGQRITKVVRTLNFIEQRVERMIEIWGGLQALGAGPVVIDDLEEPEQDLLNGPALASDEDKVSQGDIDALFN